MADYENLSSGEEQAEIPLDCDYLFRRTDVRRWNRNSRQWELMETAPVAEGWISETRGGEPIDVSLKTDLIFGAPGDVDGELDGADVSAHLTEFLYKPVFDCVRIAASDGEKDYIDSKEVLVVPTATPRAA